MQRVALRGLGRPTPAYVREKMHRSRCRANETF